MTEQNSNSSSEVDEDFESTWQQKKANKKSYRAKKIELRPLDDIVQQSYVTGQLVYHQDKKVVLRLERPVYHKQTAHPTQ